MADQAKGPLEIGEQFLKFQIRGLLGRGGHAWVYHGYDQFLDRHVAIKVIPDPAEPGRELRERAQMEARVLCRLQHPNVVHVIDAGTTKERGVYIVMEILHGRTLRDVIQDLQPLRVSEVLSIGIQIANGVQAAHRQNVIHRDLKPENIFILEENVLKVLDFGIAKFLGYGAKTTQRDVIHGTMLYMSPEHLQGFGVTVRSDIYAIGTVLYEAFAGRPPCLIGIQDPTAHTLAFSQINRMPPPLDELTGTVPHFIARTIQRMIAKDPADRFTSMTEVTDLLRANWHRYDEESAGATEPPRKLWESTPRVDTLSAGRAKNLGATELQESGPRTVPSVEASGHTLPVTRPQFSASVKAQTSYAGAVPAEVPGPSSNRCSTSARIFKEARPSASDTLAPASRGDGMTPTPEASTSTPSPHSLHSQTRARRRSVRNVVIAAVVFGGGIGAVSGALGIRGHSSASTSDGANERIMVVSSARVNQLVARAPSTSAATNLPPPPNDSAAPSSSDKSEPAVSADAGKGSRAKAASNPSGLPSHPTARAATSGTAIAPELAKSGLWDMSDLDSKTKPPTAKPTKQQVVATPKSTGKPIFGADDIK